MNDEKDIYIEIIIVLPICLHLDNREFYLSYKKGKNIVIRTENIYNNNHPIYGSVQNMEVDSDSDSRFRFSKVFIKIPLFGELMVPVEQIISTYSELYLKYLNTFLDQYRFVTKRSAIKNYTDLTDFIPPVTAKTSKDVFGEESFVSEMNFFARGLTTALDDRSEEDHLRLQEYLNNNIPLHEKFMIDAERDFHYGNFLHSIINGVISLEIIIAELFGLLSDKTNISKEVRSDFIKNVGIYLNLAFTLKLVSNIALMPDDKVFENCQSAISIRNKIVHQGKRDIGKNDVETYLSSIKEMTQYCQNYINQLNT